MFEEFSVGLETSPGAWKYFVVAKKTTVSDLKQKFPLLKNFGFNPNPDSTTA